MASPATSLKSTDGKHAPYKGLDRLQGVPSCPATLYRDALPCNGAERRRLHRDIYTLPGGTSSRQRYSILYQRRQHLPALSIGSVIAVIVLVVALVLGLDHQLSRNVALLIAALATARLT